MSERLEREIMVSLTGNWCTIELTLFAEIPGIVDRLPLDKTVHWLLKQA